MRHTKSIAVLVLICLLYYITSVWNIAFYFTGSLELHKIWFPRFYLFSFLFFKAAFPLLFATWCLLYLQHFERVRQSKIISTAIFTLSVTAFLFLFQATVFERVMQGIFILIALQAALSASLLFKPFTAGIAAKPMLSKYGMSVIFFVGYIVACLICKDEFHPFYKFSMYNKIEGTKPVFILKDTMNNVVPLERCFTISENGIYLIYTNPAISLSNKNNYSDSSAGQLLWREMLTFKKSGCNVEPLSLYKRELHVKDGKVIADEYLIHKNETGPFY